MFVPKALTCQQVSIPSLVSSSYAPKGRHLIMCTELLSQPSPPDELQKQLKSFLGDRVFSWTFLHAHHTQMALPKPIKKRLDVPTNYEIGGDWTQFPSIEGAMKSGLIAVERVLKKCLTL